MRTIYVESEIKNNPATQKILNKFKDFTLIECQHYGEIFNLRNQNFRLQKQNPSLILAQKRGKLVLPTPESFGIGGALNYYFSHMLNCLYDCRYCFLQGLYSSASYVIFINFEDFKQEIDQLLEKYNNDSIYFFSGYDCDSLAYEPITGFVQDFLPFFAQRPRARLELRTKSTNIRALMEIPAISNCIVAYSLMPEKIASVIEHKAPKIEKRLHSLALLAKNNWPIGIRLDPLIFVEDYQEQYRELIQKIFDYIPSASIHSISLGPLRFPEKMFRRLVELYPQDRLLAGPLVKREKHFSYSASKEEEMKNYINELLLTYVSNSLVFECSSL